VDGKQSTASLPRQELAQTLIASYHHHLNLSSSTPSLHLQPRSNSVSLFPQDAKNALRGYGASQVRGDRARINRRFEAMTPIHTMQKQGHVLAGSNSWLSRFQLFGFGCL